MSINSGNQRVHIPESLKGVFRSVGMMLPDSVMIAEGYLCSCGFINGGVLAKKLINTYKLFL
jgi:hypothetical protein